MEWIKQLSSESVLALIEEVEASIQHYSQETIDAAQKQIDLETIRKVLSFSHEKWVIDDMEK
ncbi:hypothetical protein MKZ08_16380 [Viridibacillus sp. FSL R5-0477]|uniref:Uncharacterized protein n=1 Tax=Viridibacillus arenosi FSL R5-213 TaxID=1227360 RepID=W4EKY7_9BACL|nr:hypothetical protein [Viridibacillus arenosi]ETT81248.1 hypothetical protein C176_21119 [Viridibacillus arenosi FSL R5-213]OMC93341.1 hypothetical protein BK137_02160 [Viridibacillus arenosi]